MNSYNNVIIGKIVDYVRYVTKRLLSEDDKRKVRLTRFEVQKTNDEVNSEGTIAFEIHFTFEITSEDGELNEITRELFVPKLKNNIFTIQNKPRTATMTLDNSNTLRIYHQKKDKKANEKERYYISVNNYLKINYFLESKIFVVSVVDPNTGEYVEFEGTDENYEKYKKYLKLSEKEKYILQIKFDTDKVNDYLDRDILNKLVELGPNKNNDNIIDKQIYTIENDLINALRDRKTHKEILESMRKKFYQYGLVYLTDIQNAINNYFYVASRKNINIPLKVNPLTFDSLKYKIEFPDYLAYNDTFTDIIDVVNTPENQNVNRLNELNVCCEINEGEMYIWCYEFSTGEKVKVLYLEYLNRKVLLNDFYDYENNTIVESDEYCYKLRQKEYKIKSLDNIKINYIEPKADEKLSPSTRCIPMINASDSVRVAMGDTMQRQAIETEGSEPRLIASGNEEEDYNKSSMITRYEGKNPIIIESTEGNKINYRDKKTKSKSYFTIDEPMVGMNDVSITYSPNVKVGDEVVKGDVLIAPTIMRNKSYDYGTNALVFYMNYLGYTYEDGIVISESFANKTAHYNIHDLSITIGPDDLVLYLNKIGKPAISKDVLVYAKTPKSENSITKLERRMGLLKKGEKLYRPSKLVVVNNVDEGYIVDARIDSNPKNPIKDNNSLNKIKEFLSNPKDNGDINLPDHYKNLKLKPATVDPDFSYVISYKVIRINKTKVGDKLTNSWGSKGIISLVLPDYEMPYRDMDKKPADLLLNPSAVVSRKNPSQLYEVNLTKIIREIYLVTDWNLKHDDKDSSKETNAKIFKNLADIDIKINHNKIEEVKNKLPKVLYGDKFKKMTTEEFIENHKKGVFGYAIKVGSYSKIKYEDVMDLMKQYDVCEADKIISPVIGPIENPIITGESYIMKLFHAADYYGKVTSTVMDSHQPYMGRGIYRDEGQKIGEMELWALAAYGVEDFVSDQSPKSRNSQYELIQEILLSGHVLLDENKMPYDLSKKTLEQNKK